MDDLDIDDLEHEVDLDSSDDEEGVSTPETRAAARKSKAAKAEDRTAMLEYPLSMPYACESIDEFDERLLLIASRLVACVKARE